MRPNTSDYAADVMEAIISNPGIMMLECEVRTVERSR